MSFNQLRVIVGSVLFLCCIIPSTVFAEVSCELACDIQGIEYQVILQEKSIQLICESYTKKAQDIYVYQPDKNLLFINGQDVSGDSQRIKEFENKLKTFFEHIQLNSEQFHLFFG